MMSNNKILTVSYGTFSCTLEGFDDSFGTMKAIAEYFRDLAADDRYFGAEPPQPDAEMLARIAQKEVSRRVHAREQDGKIVLSALEDGREDQAAAVPAAEVAATADAVAKAPPADSPTDAAPLAPAEDTTDDVAADAVADVDTAAEDAVIAEAPVGENAIEVEDQPDTVAQEDQDTAVLAQEAVEHPAEEIKDDVSAEVAEEENDIVPGQPDAAVEAFFAEMTTDNAQAEFEDEIAEDEAPTAPIIPQATPAPVSEVPAQDSIAAKLQRIRAVVAQHDDSAEDDDYAEDQHADFKAPEEATIAPAIAEAEAVTTADAIAEARHDIEDALNADDAADQAMGEAELLEDEDDDYSAILSRLQQSDAADEAQEYAHIEEDDMPETDDALANLFGTDDDADDDNTDDAEAHYIAAQVTEIEVAAPEAAEAPEHPAAPRARVIKVKRADLEAAIERGVLEEYDDADDDDAADDFDVSHDNINDTKGLDDLAPAKSASTSLSFEDERELALELSALERDIESDPSRAEDANDSHGIRAANARNVLPEIEDETTGDMSRLMAEADHQMDEPESTTRRNAFAHLRAAVAAKKADAAIGISDDKDEKDDAYRSDLAEVVRPRRPVSGSVRTARPAEARPGPLKLVAEQRIDVVTPRPAGPVRPRRVAAAAVQVEAPQADGSSFAEYADEMGAASLPELLEAAAAYMAFVEGFEQFSRPQLMTKVRQVGPEDGFSREDGLRSFGQLLRSGKIEKIKSGRFTVSDDIGYRPDQRAAG